MGTHSTMQEDHEDEGQKAFSALQAREKADVTAQVKSELEAAAAKAAAHIEFVTRRAKSTNGNNRSIRSLFSGTRGRSNKRGPRAESRIALQRGCKSKRMPVS